MTLVLVILFSFTFTLPVSAGTLNYWYSDSDRIGKWTSSPTIWYSKIDPNPQFPFVAGLQHGRNIWNNALGTSITISSSATNAPIKFYGGTKAQLDALNIFNPIATSNLGRTVYTNITYRGTHTYNFSPRYWYSYNRIDGFVVSRTDMSYNNYLKTASHEVGHAMGWRGHPTNRPTWIMQQGKLENTTFKQGERNHLLQIY